MDLVNKKGQVDFPVITLIVVLFIIVLMAPIILKIWNSVSVPLSNSLSNMSGGEQAGAAVTAIVDKGVSIWDTFLMALFIIALITMIISAILIDTHPIFVILFMVMAFITVLFAPTLIDSLSGLYDSPEFATELTQLTMVNHLRTNFTTYLVGFIILSGIIMFGKVAFFPSSPGGPRR